MTEPSPISLHFLSPAQLSATPTPILLAYTAAALSAVEAVSGPLASARDTIISLEARARARSEPFTSIEASGLFTSFAGARDSLRSALPASGIATIVSNDRARMLCALDGLAELAGRGVLGSLDTAPFTAQ